MPISLVCLLSRVQWVDCPGFEIEIIDNEANILEIDKIGNIGIKITNPYPPGLFKGYYKDKKERLKFLEMVGILQEIQQQKIKTGIFGLLEEQMI